MAHCNWDAQEMLEPRTLVNDSYSRAQADDAVPRRLMMGTFVGSRRRSVSR